MIWNIGCHHNVMVAFLFFLIMVEIDGKIISLDIFSRRFLCDLQNCKGICCVEGDSGAPLEKKETEILDRIYPQIKHLLAEKSREEVERQGKWVVDEDCDFVTPIINGEECVYAIHRDGVGWTCAIEEAYNQGIVDFKKPISCHLYPIRVRHYRKCDALNFHEWSVCSCALKLGKEKDVPVYKFLKEPLVRAYGESFFEELEKVAVEIEKQSVRR